LQCSAAVASADLPETKPEAAAAIPEVAAVIPEVAAAIPEVAAAILEVTPPPVRDLTLGEREGAMGHRGPSSRLRDRRREDDLDRGFRDLKASEKRY
jgi:hypothetical protein